MPEAFLACNRSEPFVMPPRRPGSERPAFGNGRMRYDIVLSQWNAEMASMNYRLARMYSHANLALGGRSAFAVNQWEQIRQDIARMRMRLIGVRRRAVDGGFDMGSNLDDDVLMCEAALRNISEIISGRQLRESSADTLDIVPDPYDSDETVDQVFQQS
jgi:hypothetical protein